MSTFTPASPDFAERVRDSFARQSVMTLIGAELARVEPGLVEIQLPYRDDLCQQHGFFHAGVTSTIGDSAGGYAAYSLFPAGSSIRTSTGLDPASLSSMLPLAATACSLSGT